MNSSEARFKGVKWNQVRCKIQQHTKERSIEAELRVLDRLTAVKENRDALEIREGPNTGNDRNIQQAGCGVERRHKES